jgi:hypothetical protein
MNDEAPSYKSFFTAVRKQVTAVRGSSHEPDENERINARATQIFIMEIYLQNYRRKHQFAWSRLPGIRAAHHRILMKFHWAPSVIETLSVEQLFFALLDDLEGYEIPVDAHQVLARHLPHKNSMTLLFSDFLEKEWLPEIADRLLPEI